MDALPFKKSHILAFCLAFSSVILMMFVRTIQFRPFHLLDAVNVYEKKVPVMEDIKTKLQKIKNDFRVKETNGIVSAAYASGSFSNLSAYIVIDEDTGEVLFEQNMNKSLPIASLTKVMSSVVALDLSSADELLTISKRAAMASPTKIGVVTGEKMKVVELLNATLLTSANDAAKALQDGVDQKYNSKVFINAMNEKARFLGMTGSSFDNPQGFDGYNNYSTAKDLAILSQYALSKYPLIAEIAKKDYAFLQKDENHKQFDLYNWNGLLGVYPGVRGVKIGNTDAAKMTTIVSSERESKKVMVVVLGAADVPHRDLSAAELLNLGFEKLSVPAFEVTESDLQAKYSSWKYFN